MSLILRALSINSLFMFLLVCHLDSSMHWLFVQLVVQYFVQANLIGQFLTAAPGAILSKSSCSLLSNIPASD